MNVSILSLTHSLSFFGRSANFTASLPYGVGNFQGTVAEAETRAYRSGMLNSSFRFSVNLKGGPAMDVHDFRKWTTKDFLGCEFQGYGSNRAIRPNETDQLRCNTAGPSNQNSACLDDGAIGCSTPTEPYGFSPRTMISSRAISFLRAPIPKHKNHVFAFEGHLSYDVNARFWASLDGNFWDGGRSSVNGVENPATLQKNSRIGGTVLFR